MQIEGSPKTFTCPACGLIYARCETCNPGSNPVKLNTSFWSLAAAFILGGLTLGAFIWAPLGRLVAVRAISKGAAVTTAKVEEWLERGE